MASEADGEVEARRGPSLYGAVPVLLRGWIGRAPFPIWCCPKVEVPGPNWALPGASGGQSGGLVCRPELAGALSRAGGVCRVWF